MNAIYNTQIKYLQSRHFLGQKRHKTWITFEVMKVQKNSLSLLFALFLKWHFRGCLVAQFGERDEESFFLSISRLPRFVCVCVCRHHWCRWLGHRWRNNFCTNVRNWVKNIITHTTWMTQNCHNSDRQHLRKFVYWIYSHSHYSFYLVLMFFFSFFSVRLLSVCQ